MTEPRACGQIDPERQGATRPLAFVGPLSPPVHGFFTITVKMRNVLRERVELLEVDTAPSVGRLARLARTLRVLARILAGRTSGVYVGFSGGPRQLIDLAFVLAARLAGQTAYVHHHNFSYLDRWKATTWLNMLFLRRAVHIVLCECMADALSARYGVERGRMAVLSNAAFLESPAPDVRRRDKKSLSIGFFSNITAEKGIFEFFRIVRRLQVQGQARSVLIAGPVSADVREAFEAALHRSPQVKYLGPVYGRDKDAFLRRLDVLVFPTLYRNEAEPVSVLEAISHGVIVAAYGRGCLAERLKAGLGLVVPPGAAAAPALAERLAELLRSPAAVALQRRQALEALGKLQRRAAGELHTLRDTMAARQRSSSVSPPMADRTEPAQEG